MLLPFHIKTRFYALRFNCDAVLQEVKNGQRGVPLLIGLQLKQLDPGEVPYRGGKTRRQGEFAPGPAQP